MVHVFLPVPKVVSANPEDIQADEMLRIPHILIWPWSISCVSSKLDSLKDYKLVQVPQVKQDYASLHYLSTVRHANTEDFKRRSVRKLWKAWMEFSYGKKPNDNMQVGGKRYSHKRFSVV